MVLLYLLVLVLVGSHPVSATTSGQNLPRGDGTAARAFPEPLVFHNLTRDEFDIVLSEHRGNSVKRDGLAHDDIQHHTINAGRISKRVPRGREDQNDARGQALVEQLSMECVNSFGQPYRFTSGTCVEGSLDFYCYPYPTRGARFRRHRKMKCESTSSKPRECLVARVINYHGKAVNAPYCADVLPVEHRTKEVDWVETYEGYTKLMDEIPSPGTIDTFWELTSQIEDLKGHYEYRGHDASGKTFISQSPKQSHSWCCLGCPPGVLYVQTIGFKAQAVGFSLAAGSWY